MIEVDSICVSEHLNSRLGDLNDYFKAIDEVTLSFVV